MRTLMIVTMMFSLLAPMTVPVWASEFTVLEALVQEALQNNPDLKGGEARWMMARHQVEMVGVLEDPRLSLGLSSVPIDSFKSNQTPMSSRDVKLSQKFPYPGKLEARKDQAIGLSRGFEGRLEEKKLQLRSKVAQRFFAYYRTGEQLEVANRSVAILDDFIRVTETRYSTGKATQAELLRAQMELSRVLNTLLVLEQQQRVELEGLNRLLNRPVGTPLALPAELPFTSFALDLDSLLSKAREQRPALAAAAADVEAAKAQRRQARLDYLPDFNLGLVYKFRENNPGDDGTDFVGMEIGFNIPWDRSRRSEAVASAASGISMSQSQYQDSLRRIEAEVHDNYALATRLERQIQLYRTGLIPQANQTSLSANAAYQGDRGNFLQVLESFIALFRLESDYYALLSDYYSVLARLEAAAAVAVFSDPQAFVSTEVLP